MAFLELLREAKLCMSGQFTADEWDRYGFSQPPCLGTLRKGIGPASTQQVAGESYIRNFDESRKNMRAWERAHPEKIE